MTSITPILAEAESLPAKMSPQDRHKILVQWNQTHSPCDTNRCVHWLFEDRVRHAPEATAVDDGKAIITYAELNRRSNYLAHQLISMGVARGSRVGVCVDRSTDLIAALLAILKAGATYIPIEPTWPDNRVKYNIESVGVCALLIDSEQTDRAIRVIGASACKIARVENGLLKAVGRSNGNAASSSDLPTHNPPRIGNPDDLAYIIFTSGSSGNPKAVAVRHRPVINLIDWVTKTFGVGPADKLLFTTSIAFDLSVYDIFGILAEGGTIRIASTEEVREPQTLAEILISEAITFWDSAPAALERLRPYLPSEIDRSRLRLVFLSGDWIPLALPTLIKSRFRNARVIALGGATEATVWSNFYEVGEVDPDWNSIPYGRPIQNCQYYVLNGNLDPCPLGASGELYIGGACLADGYINDPELTRLKFIANPFAPAQRLYRTGDRARYLADGNIEFLGRADRQVKIRGFRVELAEVEIALQCHPAVRQAVVIAAGETRCANRLIAYVVPHEWAAPASLAKELSTFLGGDLPAYMVPARVELLAAFPLNANGKVDLSALCSMSVPMNEFLDPSDEPKTQTQRQIAKLWRRLLGLSRVGVHESFFEIGGDSLRSVEMISAAAAIGFQWRMKDLYERPTIAALCQLPSTPNRRKNHAERDGLIPLTPTQHWFFERGLRFPGRYNSVLAFDVVGSLDADRLTLAMHHLQAQHDALRLRFTSENGAWTQRIASCDVEPSVATWDLASCPEPAQSAEMQRRVAEMRCALDLASGPLAMAVLIDRGPSRPLQLLLLLHHLLFDAASIPILIDDLATALHQIEKKLAVSLPESCPFASWAHRLSDYAKSQEAIAERDYWLGLPWPQIRPLPRDFPIATNRYRSARTLRAELSQSETNALSQRAPHQYRASIGEILLAGCLHILSKWSAHQTLHIDLTSHGRNDLLGDLSLARTVGYITVSTPIVITLPQNATANRAIELVHEHLRDMPNSGIGYGILRYLRPEGPQLAALRQFSPAEVKFNFLGSLSAATSALACFQPAIVDFPGVLDPDDHRAYLHNIEIALVADKLQFEWKYSADIHRAQTIELLLQHYMATLRDLIQNASCTSEPFIGRVR